jgi:ribosomal protein L29
MEIAELKSKNPAELKELLAQQKSLLHTLSVKAKMRSLKQVHSVRETKKSVARIMTLLG